MISAGTGWPGDGTNRAMASGVTREIRAPPASAISTRTERFAGIRGDRTHLAGHYITQTDGFGRLAREDHLTRRYADPKFGREWCVQHRYPERCTRAFQTRQFPLCNAHHLRELKALVEIEKEDWARRMQRLLRRACHAVNLARAQNLPLRPEMIALIERCYDAVVADGLAYHTAQPALTKARPRGPPPRRVGHNLLLRLSTRKADVLRFLTDPSVPFTNNLAERDGRMMKLRQKISGGFRSEQGAADFAVIRSLISTARKQGWDLLQTLTAEPAHLIARLRLA